ncbi:MAG: cadherin repeat domain-containing protein, partial [Thermoguttaceae bacterium]
LRVTVPEPSDVADVKLTEQGPMVHPLKEGKAQVGAELKGLKTTVSLLIDVGNMPPVVAGQGGGRLIVAPDTLVLWSGEVGQLAGVRVDPGNGQPSAPIQYKLSDPAQPGVVSVDPQNQIKALANGTAQVTVTATDPQYAGLSAPVTVQVISPDKLAIEPADFSLQVGQQTPLITVKATAADGTMTQVPAMVESMDPNVIEPVSSSPGTFAAKGVGQTKLKAAYRGVECFATVSVTGQRFLDVRTTTLSEGPQDFDVTIEVLAAGSEGELEYRVYAKGQPPAENWVANEPQGDAQGGQRKAVLHSPRLAEGPKDQLYDLVIEARDKAGKTQQAYPFTFQLKRFAEQVKPQP